MLLKGRPEIATFMLSCSFFIDNYKKRPIYFSNNETKPRCILYNYVYFCIYDVRKKWHVNCFQLINTVPMKNDLQYELYQKYIRHSVLCISGYTDSMFLYS